MRKEKVQLLRTSWYDALNRMLTQTSLKLTINSFTQCRIYLNMTVHSKTNDIELSRQEILDAAARAFMEQGFNGTSIDTVADVLGCTKGRIYYHFKSKADLFFDVHRTGMLLNHDIVKPIAESDSTPEVRLRMMLAAQTDFITTYLPYSKVVVQGVKMHLDASTTPLQRKTLTSIMDLHRSVEKMFLSVLTEGIRSGVFEKGDPKIIVKGMLGVINWMTIWYSHRPKNTERDRKKLINEIVDYAMRGVEVR